HLLDWVVKLSLARLARPEMREPMVDFPFRFKTPIKDCQQDNRDLVMSLQGLQSAPDVFRATHLDRTIFPDPGEVNHASSPFREVFCTNLAKSLSTMERQTALRYPAASVPR